MRHTTTTRINGAKNLKQYIAGNSQLLQHIREEILRDIQEERATVADPSSFPHSSWKCRVEKCCADHASFVYDKCTGLPQFSTFLKNEENLTEALNQLEHMRKMLVTNKQQKNTEIHKLREIMKLAKKQESREERLQSPTFDFVETVQPQPMMTDDDDDDDALYYHDQHNDQYDQYDNRNDYLLESADSAIVKALKGQIETTKQHHRTITNNLLQQVNTIARAVRRYIVDVKKSAEDNVGEIIHHADKCRAFIAKCFKFAVLEICAAAWWNQTQRDAMDHNYYHITIELENPEDGIFNSNAAMPPCPSCFPAQTSLWSSCSELLPANIKFYICVYNGNTTNPESMIHRYEVDQNFADTIYTTEESLHQFQASIRHFNRAKIVATREA